MIDRKTIEELAAVELADANRKHYPAFNSQHEAYAVIKEELEETELELEMCKERMMMLWDCVKNDDDCAAKRNIEYMRAYAINTVREGIQVVAMCDKALGMY